MENKYCVEIFFRLYHAFSKAIAETIKLAEAYGDIKNLY